MKKIFKTMLLTVLLLACAITAHAAPSEPEGYPFSVNDRTTPAVFAPAGTGPSPHGTSTPRMARCWGVSQTGR